jgi:hypothetical protein
MGNTASASTHHITATLEKTNATYFIIERLLAANCHFLPENANERSIRVGTIGSSRHVSNIGFKSQTNPLGNQGIRIGDSPIYEMKSFIELPNTLIYKFENDVQVTIFKSRGRTCIHLKTPDLDETIEVDPKVARFYKRIDMAADELDKIETIYKMQ